jgi:hypothetical protein
MMKIAAIVVSSATLAGAAAADLIAGWDFSQYRVDGSLDAGAGAVDTLPANYSSLAPNGAGSAAGAFGTLFMDGSQGSTNVNEGAASPGPEVVAHATDTKANRLAPLDLADGSAFPVNAFDAFNTLRGDGQVNQSRVGLTARTPANLVFQADQGAISQRTWAVSFAGYALDPTGSVDVGVEFAPSCGAYVSVGTVTLTQDEQAFEIPMANVSDDDVCVRLSLDNANGQPVIDNVAVPEPGFAASFVAGVLALMGLQRRRRA